MSLVSLKITREAKITYNSVLKSVSLICHLQGFNFIDIGFPNYIALKLRTLFSKKNIFMDRKIQTGGHCFFNSG